MSCFRLKAFAHFPASSFAFCFDFASQGGQGQGQGRAGHLPLALTLGSRMLVRRMAFANVQNAFCQISQTSQSRAVSNVVAGRLNRLYRYILALGQTFLVPCMAFANVRNTFGQISQTSQPKAVSKVVTGRFSRVNVRSTYFGSWTDIPRAVYGIC